MNDSSTSLDKQWAKNYILDPLTAPEPSQETGPGSSFIRPLSRSLSVRSSSNSNKQRSTNPYPSPPTSTSPTRSNFHPSNPFSPTLRYSSLSSGGDSPERTRPFLGRSNSSGFSRRSPEFVAAGPSGSLGRSQSVRQPPLAHQNHASGHSRSQSVKLDKGKDTLRRSGSLNQRYPGDMSHRPLDMIRRDVRAADRAPHLRRKGMPGTDTIDGLDSTAFGGAYHHGGPYDATLSSRNANKMYSPVEAVKDSNLEALKATPREYIQDSLEKHVPLQGTALIPPGGTDMSGNVMSYEEGADLMRENDAGGGPYKRWDCVPYHPDDLKGKGEPSYTIERDLKENKARQRKHMTTNGKGSTMEYEMQPRTGSARKGNGATVRQRSVSAAAEGSSAAAAARGPRSPTSPGGTHGTSTGAGGELRRSNTTGKRITEGLKRRFGSLRRKKNPEDV